MSDDIVTHLRNQHELKKLAYPELCKNTKTIYEEAADEIERLRKDNEILLKVAGEEGRANRMTDLYNSSQAQVERLRSELVEIYTAAWEAVRAIELSDGEKLKEFREWMMGTLKKEG